MSNRIRGANKIPASLYMDMVTIQLSYFFQRFVALTQSEAATILLFI